MDCNRLCLSDRNGVHYYLEAYLKSLYSVASVLVLAAVAACGGGGEGGKTSGGGNGGIKDPGNPPPAALLNDTPQIIEYHGDSTIWGYRSNTGGDRVGIESRAPSVFAAELSNRHQVINMGRNATSVCELLAGDGAYRIEPAQPSWQEHMSNSEATVVIINHGINDVSRGSGNGDTYRQCLNQVVDIAQAAGKVVILETPNPIANSGLEAYVEVMREVAISQGVDLIDQYDHLIEAFEANPEEVCPDGVHPAEEIYVEKGRYAASRFATFASP